MKEGCEPTYEELKQSFQELKAKAHIGCEPTYEELKLVTVIKPTLSRAWLRAYL